MILLIDNYDSFVHNLARYFEELGVRTRVRRNGSLTLEQIRRLSPQALVISPGPCDPDRAGISVEAVREFHGQLPILGICLGHQAIARALGGKVVRAPEPVHGMPSPVHHDGQGIFQGIPSPFFAARYHSLTVREEDLPEELSVSATTPDGRGGRVIMAFRHRSAATVGLQFHPESVLTEYGHHLLHNFLRLAGESPGRLDGTDWSALEAGPRRGSRTASGMDSELDSEMDATARATSHSSAARARILQGGNPGQP